MVSVEGSGMGVNVYSRSSTRKRSEEMGAPNTRAVPPPVNSLENTAGPVRDSVVNNETFPVNVNSPMRRGPGLPGSGNTEGSVIVGPVNVSSPALKS